MKCFLSSVVVWKWVHYLKVVSFSFKRDSSSLTYFSSSFQFFAREFLPNHQAFWYLSKHSELMPRLSNMAINTPDNMQWDGSDESATFFTDSGDSKNLRHSICIHRRSPSKRPEISYLATELLPMHSSLLNLPVEILHMILEQVSFFLYVHHYGKQ